MRCSAGTVLATCCFVRRTPCRRTRSWPWPLGQLVGVYDGCAELADHDAGRLVGDAHRAGDVRARTEKDTERGDDGIARAGHVVDLARLRRNVDRAGIRE